MLTKKKIKDEYKLRPAIKAKIIKLCKEDAFNEYEISQLLLQLGYKVGVYINQKESHLASSNPNYISDSNNNGKVEFTFRRNHEKQVDNIWCNGLGIWNARTGKFASIANAEKNPYGF